MNIPLSQLPFPTTLAVPSSFVMLLLLFTSLMTCCHVVVLFRSCSLFPCYSCCACQVLVMVLLLITRFCCWIWCEWVAAAPHMRSELAHMRSELANDACWNGGSLFDDHIWHLWVGLNMCERTTCVWIRGNAPKPLWHGQLNRDVVTWHQRPEKKLYGRNTQKFVHRNGCSIHGLGHMTHISNRTSIMRRNLLLVITATRMRDRPSGAWAFFCRSPNQALVQHDMSNRMIHTSYRVMFVYHVSHVFVLCGNGRVEDDGMFMFHVSCHGFHVSPMPVLLHSPSQGSCMRTDDDTDTPPNMTSTPTTVIPTPTSSMMSSTATTTTTTTTTPTKTTLPGHAQWRHHHHFELSFGAMT